MMKVELVELEHWSDAPLTAEAASPVASETYERRIRALRESASSHSADWTIVYGDREHAGNLSFLCGFDPRFEEALLAISTDGLRRVLVVGNEGAGYTSALTVPVSEVALCQSFSLMGQPRSRAPRLDRVLRDVVGIGRGQRVGVVGWKYLEPEESSDDGGVSADGKTGPAPAFMPCAIVDAVRQAISVTGQVFDLTDALLHPERGIMTAGIDADQIAAYAWAAERASVYTLRMVRAARPGLTERQVAAHMGYEGDPLSCHVMMTSAGREDGGVIGLRSPGSRVLRHGDGLSTAVGLRGGLCARAGVLIGIPDPDFTARYVEPYFRAIATWWQTVRINATGGDVWRAVHEDALRGAPFAPMLNPGHLTGIEEWTHTPIREGSAERLASGTMLQCDIIPTPMPDGRALNCEDTAALADEELRGELRTRHPALWKRIEARQAFMREQLGIDVPDDLLPLSVAPACLAPYWLAPNLICHRS